MTRTTSVTAEVTPTSQTSSGNFPSTTLRSEYLEENRLQATGASPADKKEKPEALTQSGVESTFSSAGITVTGVTTKGKTDTVEFKNGDGKLYGKVDITTDDKEGAVKASADVLKRLEEKKAEGEVTMRVDRSSVSVRVKNDAYGGSGRLSVSPSELGNLKPEQIDKALERAVPPLPQSEVERPFKEMGAEITGFRWAGGGYEVKFNGGNISAGRARIDTVANTPERFKSLEQVLDQVEPKIEGSHSYSIAVRRDKIDIGITDDKRKLHRATIPLDGNGAIKPENLSAAVEKLTGAKVDAKPGSSTKPEEKPSSSTAKPGASEKPTETKPGSTTTTPSEKPASEKPAVNPLPETLKLNNDRATLAVTKADTIKLLGKDAGNSVSIIENKHGKTLAVISHGTGVEVKTTIVEVDLKQAKLDLSKLTGTTYTDKDGYGKGEGAVKTQGKIELSEEGQKQLAEAFNAARTAKGLQKKEETPAATPKPSPSPSPAPSPKPAATIDGSKLVVDNQITAAEQALFKLAMQTPAFVEFIKTNKDIAKVEVKSDGATMELKEGYKIGFDKQGALVRVQLPGADKNALDDPAVRPVAYEKIQKKFEELLAEFNAKVKK